jgi:RNA-binding protein YhbY
MIEVKYNLGKNGLTPQVMGSLNFALKTHKQIRISVLKSLSRDKQQIKQLAEEMLEKAQYLCKYRIIGFTIILRKQSSKLKHRST